MSRSDEEYENISHIDSEIVGNVSDFDPDWRFIAVTVEEADPICKRLNRLIKDGRISKNKIFYKYLSDVVEFFYNPLHRWDEDVKEFFASIAYLGGKSTYNMIRGPMQAGQGRFCTSKVDPVNMNLGGPSKEVLRKMQAAYTTRSGVQKHLSSLSYTLCDRDASRNKAAPLIQTDNLKVYPVALANDGTALHPAIQFDERMKVNVGLENVVDINYVKSTPYLKKETLQNSLVREALVTSITTLDNQCSLPVAVKYSVKDGKCGKNMKELFTNQIKLLQMCLSCLNRSKVHELVVENNEHEMCQSECKKCFENKEVCVECSSKGHISFIPSIRACEFCISNKLQCTRRVVMVLTVDCEEGNKQCLLAFKDDIEKGNIDHNLALLSLLPDCPHVLKTCKASFANWYLQFDDERGNLSFYHTLRNKAEPPVRKVLKKYLPKNDHVRNRDRQDPTAVLRLCNAELCNYVADLGYVSQTVVPEMVRYTSSNRVGMHQNIASVAIGPNGYIIFLCFEEKKKAFQLFKAKLHNPVQEIQMISSDLKGSNVYFSHDLIYNCGNESPITFHSLKPCSNPKINVENLRSKKDTEAILTKYKLSAIGTLKECKTRLSDYQKSIKRLYQENKWNSAEINFPGNNHLLFDDIAIVDKDLLFAACFSNRSIVQINLVFDSVGIQGAISTILLYSQCWERVYDLILFKSQLVIFYGKGVLFLNLETRTTVIVIPDSSSFLPRRGCVFKDGFLFLCKDDHRLHFWRSSGVTTFAGDKESGSRDGTAQYARFYRPSGIAVEFNNVVYVCDYDVGSIRMLTTLKNTATFLKSIGKLSSAFSIHEKHQKYELSTIDEAIALVQQCNESLQRNVTTIRQSHKNLPKSLNGPEGSVSSKTLVSIGILDWGLRQMRDNVTQFGYNSVNLLSCMTLDIEHLHSTVNFKHGTQTMLQYARSFSTSVKENIKSLANWSAFYYTSDVRCWYPPPENCLILSDLKFPKPTSAASLPNDDKELMREWASVNGAVVRQRSGRQETTMAKAGTLPEGSFNADLTPISNLTGHKKKRNSLNDVRSIKLTESSSLSEDAATLSSKRNSESESDQDETLQFDESEAEDDIVDSDIESEEVQVREVGNEINFLLGRSSRFGRAVRFNSKFH